MGQVWELKLQELTKADDDGDEPDAEAAPKDEKPTFLYPHQACTILPSSSRN